MKKALICFTFCFVLYNTPRVHAQNWYPIGAPAFLDSSAGYTSMAIDGSGTPYIVYSAGSYPFTAYGRATVMKYNGSNWVTVGSAGFSDSTALYTNIAIDGSGTPYVVYEDVGNSNKATVMKYNGASWVTVGTAGFSAGEAGNTSIVIDGSGTPYVVYTDWANSLRATVMKYNGSGWISVGSPGFSSGTTAFITLALDGSGTPYVAYQAGFLSSLNTGPATVMKYNGSSWVIVGSPGFSGGGAESTSIAIDTGGTPYVFYMDSVNGWKATVMKYNGSSWVNVGSPGFSAGEVAFTNIAIDRNGTPYVAYTDIANSDKATVMKYNGTSWVNIGSPGFSTGAANQPCIAINGSGTLYVAYGDSSYSYRASVMRFGWPAGVINTTSPANSINLFPNPATKSLTIASSENITNITIATLLGQTVYSNQYNTSQVQVDVADLLAGIYFVKVNGSKVQRFVKE